MVYMLSLIHLCALLVFATGTKQSFIANNCKIEKSLHGIWYDVQKKQYFSINQTFWSDKEECLAEERRSSDSVKYYIKTKDFEDNPAIQVKLILELHKNVFFYKESNFYPDLNIEISKYSARHIEFGYIFMVVRNETEMEPYTKNLCPIDKNYKANLNLIEYPEECPNSRVYQCANGKELKIQQSCMKKKSLQLYCLGWWKKPGSSKKIGVIRHGNTNPPNYKCFHVSKSDNVETLVTFNQGIHMDLCEAEPRDYYSRDVYTFGKLDDSTWSKMICRFPSWFERRKWVDMSGRYRYETWNTDKELREKLIDGDGTRTFRCVGIRSDDDHFIIHSATSSSCDPIMHCIKGIRRGDKLVELLIGSHLREEDRWDCEMSLMKTEKKILLAEDTSLVECQIRGRHTDAEDERGGCKSNLNACLSPNVITVATLCKVKKLACYHTWHHGGHKYVLVGDWEKKSTVRNCLQITEKGNTMTVITAPECNMDAPHLFGKPINITLHLHRRKCHKRKSRQKEKKKQKKSGNEKRSELEIYMDAKTPENSAPSRTFLPLSSLLSAICWSIYKLF